MILEIFDIPPLFIQKILQNFRKTKIFLFFCQDVTDYNSSSLEISYFTFENIQVLLRTPFFAKLRTRAVPEIGRKRWGLFLTAIVSMIDGSAPDAQSVNNIKRLERIPLPSVTQVKVDKFEIESYDLHRTSLPPPDLYRG